MVHHHGLTVLVDDFAYAIVVACAVCLLPVTEPRLELRRPDQVILYLVQVAGLPVGGGALLGDSGPNVVDDRAIGVVVQLSTNSVDTLVSKGLHHCGGRTVEEHAAPKFLHLGAGLLVVSASGLSRNTLCRALIKELVLVNPQGIVHVVEVPERRTLLYRYLCILYLFGGDNVATLGPGSTLVHLL